jgi:hypothetical protein
MLTGAFEIFEVVGVVDESGEIRVFIINREFNFTPDHAGIS